MPTARKKTETPKLESINTLRDLLNQLDLCSEIDTLKYSNKLYPPLVYVALYSEVLQEGFGGLLITAEEFSQLKSALKNRVVFLRQ